MFLAYLLKDSNYEFKFLKLKWYFNKLEIDRLTKCLILHKLDRI